MPAERGPGGVGREIGGEMQTAIRRLRFRVFLVVLGMTSTFAWLTFAGLTWAAPAASLSPFVSPSGSCGLLPSASAAPKPSPLVQESVRTLAPNGEALPGMKEWRGKKNPVLWDQYSGAKAFVLYREHCAACHGTGGRGDGPRALALPAGQPRATDFASGHFTYGGGDWQVMRSIWRGIPGTAMVGWYALGREARDAWILVHYVKRRCIVEAPSPTWENEPPPPGSR